MDKRISYKIVLDTETCPLDKDFEGVNANNMLTYDIGWAIVDKRGNVYATRSYLVADTFLNENDLMQSAYYKEKIPQYWEDVKNGSRIIKTLYNIRKEMLEDIENYNIKEVYAHNMRFDYTTLNITERWHTKSKIRYFFPKNVVICDTLKMARQVVAKTPTYKRFCADNGFMTKNNQVQLKAETLYRYITNDVDYIESHTALEDVLIEKDIMAYCFRKHKKMERKLWERG